MTIMYLKRGRRRPFHILGADGRTAVCGCLSLDDEGVGALAVSDALSDGLVCPTCRQGGEIGMDEALERLRAVGRIE